MNFDDIKCNEEVDEIIAIKIDDIVDKDYRKYISSIEVIRGDDFPYYLIENQKNYKFFSGKEVTYFYEFENCVIWGMTAKILNNFIKTLKDE